ncbi:MAG: sulfatase [Bacteroidetes bacterium]|nr:MAG: sulfatase [Bacteroidota bacterium]
MRAISQINIKQVAILSLVLLLSINIKAQDRPNILWLSCEDISPYLAMYGDSTANTPNLDRLANEGYVFTNVFATVGVCAPTRSSIITGMYPISIGTMHMRTGNDVMSWGNRTYPIKGKARDINGDPVPKYSAVIPDYVRCFTEYLRDAGYYCTNNQKTDYQFAAPVTAWDENNPKAHWRNTPKGMPFFSVFNDGITHESRMWKNKKLPQTVNPDSVPLPIYFPEDSIVRQDVARNYSNIEILDHNIGKKLKQLEEDGLLENTIIFFWSDHGGPLPRGKRLHYDSGLRMPLIIRIPKKWQKQFSYLPKRDDELISQVDFAPTILSLAGIPIPDYMQGQAFMGKQRADSARKYVYGSSDRFDEFTDRIRTVRDSRFLYVRNYHPELPSYKDIGYRKKMDMMNQMLYLHSMGLLNRDQNYWFRLKKTPEELYDCEKDPENLHNLIYDPKYQDKIAELRGAMDKWLEEVGDKGAIPEKQLFLQMWPNGVQPITEKAIVKVNHRKVELSCNTKGATIGYIVSDKDFTPDLNSGWTHYYKPFKIKKGQFLYTISQRIGYKESEIIKVHF